MITHVDEDILAELFTLMAGEGPEDLIHVFEMFQSGVPNRLSEADGALADGRPEDAGRAAHSLRGTAGAFGARHLGELAGEMEQACGRGDIAAAGEIVAALREEFKVVDTILTARLASVASG